MLTLYFDQLCLKLVSSELISLNETQPTLPLNSDNDFTGSVLIIIRYIAVDWPFHLILNMYVIEQHWKVSDKLANLVIS